MMIASRRSFLIGIGAALAAPAIVRAESLMKLWVPPEPTLIPYPHVSEFVVWANWRAQCSSKIADAFLYGQGFVRMTHEGIANIPPEQVRFK